MADTWAWGLQQLGHTISSPDDATGPLEVHLFFGLPDMSAAQLGGVAPRALLVNVARLGHREERFETRAGTVALMRNVPVCDWSRHNMALLAAAGVTDVSHVPVGYAPVLERLAAVTRDLDVVCLQPLDARRKAVLVTLQARGLKVVFRPDGGWPQDEADAHIARAKLVVVFDLQEDTGLFDETAVALLLANRVAVVAEVGPATRMEDDMRDCVAGAPLAEIDALCMALCADAPRRQALAERGHATFVARDWLPLLALAIERYTTQNPSRSAAVKQDVAPPRRLNIGSGKTWKHDCFNIDIDPTRGADLVFDLNTPFAFGERQETWRFGKAELGKGYFEYILAEHVFEHVRELTQCVTTCLEWLAPGGVLEVEVPYDLSYGAWQDPTHVRAFNERSWIYYTGWWWYMGWRESRFELVSNTFHLSPMGKEMQGKGTHIDVIVRTPRAVDAIRAVFKKVLLTQAEKDEHAVFFRVVS